MFSFFVDLINNIGHQDLVFESFPFSVVNSSRFLLAHLILTYSFDWYWSNFSVLYSKWILGFIRDGE